MTRLVGDNPVAPIALVGLLLIGCGALLIVGSATERMIMFGRRREKMGINNSVPGENSGRASVPQPDASGDEVPDWERKLYEDTDAATAIGGEHAATVPVTPPEAPRERARSATLPTSVTDSGVHALPEVKASIPVDCPGCEGRGYVLRTVTDLLGDSLQVIPEGAQDKVIRTFYGLLLELDEYAKRDGRTGDLLAPLFPPDLLTSDPDDEDSAGTHQRDRLWKALEALATTYRPGDVEAMMRLHTALEAFGTHHALFARPDGTFRGATWDEYQVVGQMLFETLHRLAGDQWRREWDAAWAEAYDYAAHQMFARQQRAIALNEVTMPRYPRQAKQQ